PIASHRPPAPPSPPPFPTRRSSDLPRPALGVVMAAANYPDTPQTGDAISGLDNADSSIVKTFHAGTKLEGDQVVTSGGRVKGFRSEEHTSELQSRFELVCRLLLEQK